MRERGTIPVQVGAIVALDDEPAVLLQLPDGWVTMDPDDADRVAAMLIAAADEVRSKSA